MKQGLILLLTLALLTLSGCAWLDSLRSEEGSLEECFWSNAGSTHLTMILPSKTPLADVDRALLNHPLISERYFFPQYGRLQQPYWLDCGDVRLACFYRQVDAAAKTLVHFHGNGEIVDDYLDLFVPQVAALGYNCLLVEYRGFGRSQGVPQLGKMLDDVPRIVAALSLPPEQLIFFGRSVGSLFAVDAASRFPTAAGLVLESGVADLEQRLRLRIEPSELGLSVQQFSCLLQGSFDQQQKLSHYGGPTLVFHGLYDELVDFGHAERLYQWAAGESWLHPFAQGGHNDLMWINHREYFNRLGLFLDGV